MLTKTLRLDLKRQAHHLDPVIIVGQHGITENLMSETARALDDHDLIKVKIAHNDRLIRKQYAQHLVESLHAELVHSIGKMFVLYRKKAEEEKTTKTVRHSPKHPPVTKRKSRVYK